MILSFVSAIAVLGAAAASGHGDSLFAKENAAPSIYILTARGRSKHKTWTDWPEAEEPADSVPPEESQAPKAKPAPDPRQAPEILVAPPSRRPASGETQRSVGGGATQETYPRDSGQQYRPPEPAQSPPPAPVYEQPAQVPSGQRWEEPQGQDYGGTERSPTRSRQAPSVYRDQGQYSPPPQQERDDRGGYYYGGRQDDGYFGGGLFGSDGDDTPYGKFMWVEGRLGAWYTAFNASVRSSEGATLGTDIDLSDQLGIGDSKSLIVFDGVFRFSSYSKLKINYFAASYNSTSKLDEELIFKGQVYNVNAEVETSLVLNSTRLSLEFDMVNNEIGQLGVGFAGNFITNSTSLTSFGLISTTADIKLVAPMIVGSGRVYPAKFITAGMDVAWVGYDKSNFTDIILHVDFNPVRNVGFSLGWRGINLTIETDADKATVAWNGLFVQFMARF